MKWKIQLLKIYWDEEDVATETQSIRRGMYWVIGPNIEEFEKGICEYPGTKYAVVFNSGMSALHAAMVAHGIKTGDEVIVPSFSFTATKHAYENVPDIIKFLRKMDLRPRINYIRLVAK